MDSDQLSEDMELINGQIVYRPMTRAAHSAVQTGIMDETILYRKKNPPDNHGWWIMTEISVRYNKDERPSHDIAGWKKDRVPQRPKNVTFIRPDWVCEIISPGHEKKDTFRVFKLLQEYKVPYYWVVYPEDTSIITYILAGNNKYAVDQSIDCKYQSDFKKIRIDPFKEIEMDLSYIFDDIV